MTIVTAMDSDALRLQSLGYKQELLRTFTRLTNYGITLSVVSISTGITSMFAYGLITGGPAVMIGGWIVVSFFTLFVTLSMAEICSAYPTSGGLYYWAGIIVPERHKAVASWFTGWFNLIGQLVFVAGNDLALAMLIASVVSVGLHSQLSPEPFHIILIHLVLIISHGVCNLLGPRFLKWTTHLSTWWQLLAPIIVALALFIFPKRGHEPLSFVFTGYVNETGWSNKMYVILIGLLQAQYCLTGYDAAAHMTEETKNADVAGSWGMIGAVVISVIVGWFVLIAFFFGIHDYEATVRTPTGFPITQILLDNFGREWTIFFMFLLLVACWFCGLASVTTNSRMIYAFSRDHAMPGSRWWHSIDPRVSCPAYAVGLSCFVGFVLALPYLGNSTAYSAIASVSTICLYISYVLPILCKLLYPKTFVRGPFHLGSFSKPINIVSVLWVSLIVVLFILPPVYPVTAKTMNYASVGIGTLVIFTGLGYALSARHWFHGPITNINSK